MIFSLNGVEIYRILDVFIIPRDFLAHLLQFFAQIASTPTIFSFINKGIGKIGG